MAYQPKSYRKFIATAATATLVASAVTPVLAAPAQSASTNFTDVSDRYKEAVDFLVDQKITIGVEPTRYGTTEEIKRVDAAVMIARLVLGEEEISNAPLSGFTDVPDRARLYVDALKDAGYLNGKTETEFGSEASITRGEAALILTEAYGLEAESTDVPFTDVSSRYEAAVAALVEAGVTEGKTETSFGTDDAITRGEMAIFLYRLDQLFAPVDQFVLSELPEGSWEIQDNTVTDTWGVVLRPSELPEELQGADYYVITVGEEQYTLTQNRFNPEVFSGQVSSVGVAMEDVEAGVVEKVVEEEIVYTLSDLPEGTWEIQDNTVTDTWGVVLRPAGLPEDMQGAASYTITVDGTEYVLTQNRFNPEVYSVQVSSIGVAQADVEAGEVRPN